MASGITRNILADTCMWPLQQYWHGMVRFTTAAMDFTAGSGHWNYGSGRII